MQRIQIGTLILCASAFLSGCSPAEVKPPPESIPNIPPGRSAQPAGDAGAGGGAAPAGRTPAAPK